MAVRGGRDPGLRRARLGGPLARVTALYAVAAVAATWPGVRSFTSAFIADGGDGHGETAAGDHLQLVYRFWLVGHQLARGEAPWIDPYSFQPVVEPQTVLGGWPFGFAFWPLEAAFGAVIAWNTLLLALTVATGLLTYAWLRSLDVGELGAATGGLAFAIAPYRLSRSGVHLLGWAAVLLPLALLALERSRAASTRRRAHGWGALAAAALVSVPLSGQLHLSLGVIPFVAAYVAVRFHPLAAAWAGAGVLASVGVGVALRYTVIAGSAEAGGRSLAEVGEFSAEWVDLVSRWRLGGFEDFVFLGWLTPVLAIVGLAVLWRHGRRGLALLLGVAAVVPALLALGTNLPLYAPLWHALPPLRFPRVPGRLLPLADLALAALAAVTVARAALALAGRRGRSAGVALLVLVALDLLVLPLEPSVVDSENKAYSALRTAPPGRLLELPLVEPGIHFGSVYDSYALQAPRERLSGYSTLAPRPALDFFFAQNRLSCGIWLPGDDDLLEELDVRYVALHRGVYAQAGIPGAWFAWRSIVERDFAPLASGGAVTLFGRGPAPPEDARVPEPSRARPVLCEGWRARVMDERQAPLWLHGAGTASLAVNTPGPLTGRLWVDGQVTENFTVSGRRELEAPLRGSGWHAVVVEVVELLDTNPPRGFRLERITVRP